MFGSAGCQNISESSQFRNAWDQQRLSKKRNQHVSHKEIYCTLNCYRFLQTLVLFFLLVLTSVQYHQKNGSIPTTGYWFRFLEHEVTVTLRWLVRGCLWISLACLHALWMCCWKFGHELLRNKRHRKAWNYLFFTAWLLLGLFVWRAMNWNVFGSGVSSALTSRSSRLPIYCSKFRRRFLSAFASRQTTLDGSMFHLRALGWTVG